MSLFGQSTTTATQTKPLFGSSLSTTQPQQSGSIFGGFGQQQAGNNTQPAQHSGSLFGAPSQSNQASSGLFGASAQSQQQSQNVFGQPAQQQQQQQQQQQHNGFGNSFAPQQQQQPFGASALSAPQPHNQLSQSQRAPLWQPGSTLNPRGKTIPEQMQTLLEKWSPDSTSCSFQHYFYNNVQAETVPYYGPGQGEDEQAWEEALAKKPHDGSIPVLCKGFSALGNRLRIQVQAVSALQARLHEINSSLTAMLQNHDLDISIRTVDARRRHVALSQRCLQLATKVQVLRNRGYVMDRSEEELKKKLIELERGVFDPQLNGRQEEIWARLVGIRERARFLQEETDRAGNAMADSQGDTFDEDIMRKTKKILSDYDAQIAHLHREMDNVRKDYDAWRSGAPNMQA